MKALGLVVSDKKIFLNCILKTYLLTQWPTFATNQNHLNNFGRGPHRDHSCEVWSKSNEWFQRRRCLSKKVYGRRTTTDDGQRPVTIAHPEHFFLPCDLLMQPIRKIWTIIVGDHPGIIPFKFGQIPISGSR